METLEAIFTRKSVRSYSDRHISQDDLHTILLAGMSGPSCVNARDWSFIVVRDKNTLARMVQAKLLGLPSHIIPHSILALGYPEEGEKSEVMNCECAQAKWEDDRIHLENGIAPLTFWWTCDIL